MHINDVEPPEGRIPESPFPLRLIACGCIALGWLPVACYLASSDWTAQPDGIAPVAAFLLAGLAAAIVLNTANRMLANRHRWAAVAASCVAVGAGLLGAGPFVTASLACWGVVFACQTIRWVGSLAQLDARRAAPAVAIVLLATTAMLFLLELIGPQWAGFSPCCVLAAAGSVAFAAAAPRPTDPSAPNQTHDSKLLQIAARQLVARYAVAMLLAGFFTGGMLVLFTMGSRLPSELRPAMLAPVGALAFAGLLALGWVRNREPDAMLTLELSMLVAVFAFFPFYPGALVQQQVSLVLGIVWLAVLLGCFLLVSREVLLACVPTTVRPQGIGLACLLGGMACGTIGMAAAIFSPWFVDAGIGAPRRVLFATACGAGSIALAYACTNVLLNRDLVRKVRLLAMGKFPTLLKAGDLVAAGEAVDKTPAATDNLEALCRDIALQHGLTPREYDVLVILAHGNSMARVQSDLVISEGTAITHRRNLYRKLDVHSKQELLDFVRGWGGRGNL